LSVDLSKPDQNISENPPESTYFELLSPDALPHLDFAGGEMADGPTHVRYQVQPASQEVASQPHSAPVASAVDAWATGAPLDLSDYELNQFARAAHIKASVAAALFFIVLGFFVFVAAVNGWQISLNTFDQQVKRAFGMQTVVEKQADVLLKLEVTLEKGYPMRLKRGKRVGVIVGHVQNNSIRKMQNVLLEGVLLDRHANVAATTVVPCDVVMPDRRIRRTMNRNIPKMYNDKDGKLHNCEIKSGFPVNFKIVFTTIPKDFDNSYVFQVHLKQAVPVK
jgi:hypothetical protein